MRLPQKYQGGICQGGSATLVKFPNINEVFVYKEARVRHVVFFDIFSIKSKVQMLYELAVHG